MQRNLEEISELQKRRSNRVIFPEVFGFCLMSSPFDRHSFNQYYHANWNLIWESFKENFYVVKRTTASPQSISEQDNNSSTWNTNNQVTSYRPSLIAPAGIAAWVILRSAAIVPFLFWTTIYNYIQKRKINQFSWTSFEQSHFSRSKSKSESRRELMRYLCWKYPDLSQQVNNLSDIERIVDTEIEFLKKMDVKIE